MVSISGIFPGLIFAPTKSFYILAGVDHTHPDLAGNYVSFIF